MIKIKYNDTNMLNRILLLGVNRFQYEYKNAWITFASSISTSLFISTQTWGIYYGAASQYTLNLSPENINYHASKILLKAEIIEVNRR